MKKIAAIDIGTNSMRLLLCQIQDGKIVKKEKELNTTRIGKGLGSDNRIKEDALHRNIQALKVFKEKAITYGAEAIYTVATSAVRDASNGAVFVDRAKDEVGIAVMVIDGEEEAELGFIGVLSGEADPQKNVLVIDVGGGSTELILGSLHGGIQYSKSIQAGAVRMTEAYEREVALQVALEALFKESIQVLKGKRIDAAIAIGGTGTTCASIYHKMKIYDSEKVHNTKIPFEKIVKGYEVISQMTLEERYKIVGLQPARADVIPAGLAIIKKIMESLELKELTISENDNLEGIVLKQRME